MVVSTQGHRKKKPPSFNHYPEARAKSLKKAWVEKTKIKSKWKTERQKLGLPTRSLPTESDKAQEEEDDGKVDSEMEDDEELESNEIVAVPEPSVKVHRKPPRPNPASTSQSEQAKERDAPDLRELTRKAYSRDTLHTYKSDPLNRRGGANGGRKNGRGGTRGRGQPNMKLRMDAMLEKIKRDFT
ncbi:hypothetical protein J3R30DRAFT_888525 [Lentinula aciculospora]|uniref:rRNA-processing protein FYV7 n=1 Tax=Lentinula aciculospora TaxID=153920 RepID=A0A9W9AQR9_9AGAR|nr:hypothetical protein J3R30DRAFT_888525 [Lentinula aciculospora]